MKFGLGTVQFGTAYGVSNVQGQTSPAEAEKILLACAKAGVRIVDTAANYGDSERVLGRCLSGATGLGIVTKAGMLTDITTPRAAYDSLKASLTLSLQRVAKVKVYGFLLHRAAEFLGPHADHLFSALGELKRQGLAGKIGASVYTVAEAETLMQRYQFDLIQLPLNILDQSFLKGGTLAALRARGVEIHTRSLFLQGLILMEPAQIPAGLSALVPFVEKARGLAASRGTTVRQLAVDFVRQIREVDTVIVGVNDARQLAELIPAFVTPHLTVTVKDCASLAVSDARLVNPAQWPRAAQRA